MVIINLASKIGKPELKKKTETKFIFEGNHPCIDFINTQIAVKGNILDLLEDFPDFVDWLNQAGMIMPKEAKQTLKKWKNSREAEHILEQARRLRTVLRDMIARIVAGNPVPQSTVDEINKKLRGHVGYFQLRRIGTGFDNHFQSLSDHSTQFIVPIAESASDLLCNCDFLLIKKCENPACVLYFYDVSKNHARRWCSMNICGNRMKAAAHYRRHRSK